MTFKELTTKLRICVKGRKADEEILGHLEILDFSDNEVEYGFMLGQVPAPKDFFRENIRNLTKQYRALSKEDQQKAYIYIYYNANDYPLLALKLKN